MHNWLGMFSLIINLILLHGTAQGQVNTSVEQKAAVSKRDALHVQHNLFVEGLGRGGIYSLGYEYHPSARSNFGFSYSYQSARLNPTVAEGRIELHSLPIYSNLYFPFGSHRPFVSGGVTALFVRSTAVFKFNDILQQFKLVTTKADGTTRADTMQVSLDDSINQAELFLAIPHLATGYEYRLRSGSFSRFQIISFLIDQPILWFGFSFGVGF